MKLKNKGFTLIELLVVIAIIGILSAIVLASLNTARGKGANAAVKSNLHGLRSQAEIVYDNGNQNYTGVCADPNIVSAVVAAMTAGGDAVGLADYNTNGNILLRCNESVTAWAANSLLKNPEGANLYWCVDSTGKATGEQLELSGSTSCV